MSLFHVLNPDIIYYSFKKNIVFFYSKMNNSLNTHTNRPFIQREQTYVLEKKIYLFTQKTETILSFQIVIIFN